MRRSLDTSQKFDLGLDRSAVDLHNILHPRDPVDPEHVLSKALRVAHHLLAHGALNLGGEVDLLDVSAPVVHGAYDLLAQLAADLAPGKRHQVGG